MASTRNNNTPGDYKLQQEVFTNNLDANLYKYGSNGMAYNTGLPSGGSAPPSLMWRDALSENPIDIESSLFGINSTNLVTPQGPVVPQLKTLRETKFFDRLPLVMPKDLVAPTGQRAGFISE